LTGFLQQLGGAFLSHFYITRASPSFTVSLRHIHLTIQSRANQWHTPFAQLPTGPQQSCAIEQQNLRIHVRATLAAQGQHQCRPSVKTNTHTSVVYSHSMTSCVLTWPIRTHERAHTHTQHTRTNTNTKTHTYTHAHIHTYTHALCA